jgi:tetratricopeptide (TPR) repeat protein
MILAVLSAALLAQAAPELISQDLPAPPAATEEAAPIEQAPPAMEPEQAARPAALMSASGAAAYLDTGLAAFRARRLAAARAAFENAVAADPQSAAATFYLGYTLYKLGEPSRRMNANKERARELFAKAFGLDPEFKPTFGRP